MLIKMKSLQSGGIKQQVQATNNVLCDHRGKNSQPSHIRKTPVYNQGKSSKISFAGMSCRDILVQSSLFQVWQHGNQKSKLAIGV